MTNMFEGFTYDANDASSVAEDRLSTGFSPWESGLYDLKVKLAYLSNAANSKAKAFNIEAEDASGKTYREQIWISNKEGSNQYVNQKTSKKEYLPGFLTANAICLMTTGKPLVAQPIENKTIELYNFEKKAKVPTDVPMLVATLTKEVTLGIRKRRENKTKKNDNTGTYLPVNEERFNNYIDKVFHTATGKTEAEIRNKAPAATFKDAWKKQNEGVLDDRYKEVTGQGNAGAPGGAFAGGGFDATSDNATTDPFTF